MKWTNCAMWSAQKPLMPLQKHAIKVILSENAEYDAAKEAQGIRNANCKLAKFANARLIDESQLDLSKVLCIQP